MTNKLILLATCFFTALNVAAQSYSGGSGTENDPYLISSKADMAALATATNSSSYYSTGKYFLLTQDITEAVTTIIGNNTSYRFRGTFDGGGHSVTVNISTTNYYVGVFGYTSSATIKNLGVTGTASGYAYAGGICGYAYSTTISNCYNTATISSSYYNYSDSYAGGICGYAYSATITNCYNTATISSYSSYYNTYTGGICGKTYDGTTITNCYNAATVSATSSGSYAFASGICGCADRTTITNCCNAATVSATSSSSSHAFAGSICGELEGGYITNCLSANSSISAEQGSTNSSTYIGRILGYLYSGTISNCYANATMTLNGSTVSSQDATSKNGKDYNGYISIDEIHNIIEVVNVGSIDITYGDIINLNENNLSVAFQSQDSNIAEITNNILTAKKAGAVVITANYISTNSNCQVEINQTIHQKAAVIKADTVQSIYGDTPQFTCTYSGFVNGENESVLTTLPSYTCSGTSTSNVGNYTITPSGAAAENYSFTYQNGLLQIVKRDLIVKPDSVSRIYGNSDPSFTLSYSGFVNGQTASYISQPYASTTATYTSPVGNYPITLSGGSATNYNLILQTGNLEITKAPLTVTAANQSRYWGVENPAFTFTYSGFKNSETSEVLTSEPTISCAATPYSPSGTYPIVLSGGAAQNYSFNLVNGVLTVNPNPNNATVTLDFSSPNLVTGMSTVLKISVLQENPMLAFQTDVAIPAFMSVDLSNVAMTNRCTNAHSLSVNLVSSNGSTKIYRFLIYSANNTPIQGISGELLEIPLTIDWASAPTIYSTRTVSTSGTKAVFYLAPGNTPEVTVPSASATLYFHRKGDVNINGTITISDVVAEVEYILQNNPSPFLFEAGDMNDNGIINVFDLTQIVNVIMGVSSSSPQYAAAAPRHTALDAESPENDGELQVEPAMKVLNADYELSLSNLELNYAQGITTGNMLLSMTNTHPVIALQYDLVLPDNVSVDVNNIAFTGGRTTNSRHTIAVNNIGNNTWRFLIYSSSNWEINGTSGNLLSIPLVINEQTAIGQFPVTATSPNVVYSDGGTLAETTPAFNGSFLANGVEIVLSSQTITFPAIPAKTYGDAAFTLQATATSGLPVSFVSSNTNVAIISGSTVTIVGAGTTTITASQAGNSTYAAATPMLQTLTVSKAPLTITADNKSRLAGEANPAFTISYSGFKNGETESVLDVLPSIFCSADANSPAGTYDIVLSGGSDNNYEYTLVNGVLEVKTTTAIEEVSQTAITLYPNPARNILYFKSEQSISRIEIVNQSGVLVLQKDNPHSSINISNLASGLYIVRIHTEKTITMKKLIVKE